MKTWISTLTALMLASGTPAYAQESGPGDTPITTEDIGEIEPLGNIEDLGSPDPLDVSVPEPEIQAMPEFEEIPEDGVVKGKEETPEMPVPEIAEEPEAPGFTPDTSDSLQADEPDFRRERNFHSIYKKYNEHPTPVEAWEQAAGDRRSEIYRVQKGDTLWGLSQTLFGQADYWPKIWALNKDEVFNPHEIDTWMQIRFFPGNMMDAPTLTVGDAPQVEAAPALAAGDETPASDAGLIPPPKKRTPVVRTLPRSLPEYRVRGEKKPVTNFEGLVPPAPLKRPNAPLAYYVADETPNYAGSIDEVEMGGVVASEFQYVFVKLDNPSSRILSAVKEIGTVKHNGYKGYVIEVQGEIEVIDSVGDGMYRAIVRRNLAPIEVGAKLVPGAVQEVSTADGEPVYGPNLRVVGGQFSNGRTLMESESLIFIGGGRSQGAQVGQIYGIYADRSLRVPGSKVSQNRPLIGHVRIVKVDENFSTGFVTALSSELIVGDYVGQGDNSTAALSLDDVESEFDSGDDLGSPQAVPELEDEELLDDGDEFSL